MASDEYQIDGFLMPRSSRRQRKSKRNTKNIAGDFPDELKIPKYCLFCSKQVEDESEKNTRSRKLAFKGKPQKGFSGALCNLFALPPLEYEGKLKRAALCEQCVIRCQNILRAMTQIDYWTCKLKEGKADLEGILQTTLISNEEQVEALEGKLRNSLLNYLQITPPCRNSAKECFTAPKTVEQSEFDNMDIEISHDQNTLNIIHDTQEKNTENLIETIDVKMEMEDYSINDHDFNDNCDDREDSASIHSDATDFDFTRPSLEIEKDPIEHPEEAEECIEPTNLRNSSDLLNDQKLKMKPVLVLHKLNVLEFLDSQNLGPDALNTYMIRTEKLDKNTKRIKRPPCNIRYKLASKLGPGSTKPPSRSADGIRCTVPSCKYRAKSKSDDPQIELYRLRAHQRRFHRELIDPSIPSITCPILSCSYKSKPRTHTTPEIEADLLRKHMLSAHPKVKKFKPMEKKGQLKCKAPKCGYRVDPGLSELGETGEERLVMHFKRAHEKKKKPYECPHCEKVFKVKNRLDVHVMIHTGERPFVCDICGKGFRAADFLKAHINNHKGSHPYKCDTCGRGFNNSSHLKAHITIHTGERPFKCPCGESFTQNRYLQFHRWNAHPEECPPDPRKIYKTVVPQVANKEKIWECPDCKKMFVSKVVLEGHYRIHTGEKPFQCNICGMAFRYKYLVKIHELKVHKDEVPNPKPIRKPPKIICDECGHVCATRQLFKLHHESHHSILGIIKPHKCPVLGCNKSFGPKRYLQMHMRTHRVKGDLVPDASENNQTSQETNHESTQILILQSMPYLQ